MMKGNQENVKKKNMSIKLVGGSAGGGGLAGIILLGGALALVTTFAFKRNRQSKSEKNKQEDKLNESKVKEDHALLVGEGLSFLVPDYLSPQLNNHSPRSNGTVDTQDEVSRQILLDENGETNVRNDEEMEISEKARDNTFCDEFSIIKGEFPVPVADNSVPPKLEVDRKNGSLEEVEVLKVDKETMTTECIQVGDACNDQQLPLRIDGNNQEQVEAHADDQLGLIGKAHTKGRECDGNGKTIIQILVEGVHSIHPGRNIDSHKLEDECDGDGNIILDRREILIQAAVVDQTRVDEKPHMREEECDDDAGIVIEKGEELIGEVVAENGIILSEELEATTVYGHQDVLCSDATLLISNDTETFNSKKPELLLPLIDSSSATIHGDNDHFQDHLVVENTKILKGDEANEPAIQEDHSKVEDREQKQLIEANGDNKEYYKIYREDTNDKFEEADEISVKNDQMQIWEECQKIHIDENQEKYNSGKSLPEINSFQGNGFEVQEFPFPPLDSPSLFKPGKLDKSESAETTLHLEVINPPEKDGLAEEVFAYQIVLEEKPSVQLAGNDVMQSLDDCGDTAAAKGKETLKTSLVIIAQPTKLSEEEDNNDDSKEDEEEVETIQRENFKVENNLQLPQKDHDCNDNVDTEEYVNYCDDGDVKDDNDEEEDIDSDTEEEYNVEEVEESSETTGDSSLDSNVETVWPDESVLEFSQKVIDMQANNQNFKEIKEEDSYVKFNSHKLEDDDGNSLMMAHSKQLSADTTTLKQPTNIFNLKFWFLSVLVPFLLLLWLSLSQLSYLASFHYQFE